MVGGVLTVVFLLALSGCLRQEPSVTETKEAYTLNERQIRILEEAELPTEYEKLSLMQKSAIESIEDLLCWLEQRYDDEFHYLGYVASSPVEQEHLIAASAAYPNCGPVTVYRSYENGSYCYRDNYSTLKAKLLYEQALNDWIKQFLPESEFIVFSDVSYAEDELQEERILAQASAASYIFVAEEVCTKEELQALVKRFGPWLQEQADKSQPSVTQFYLTPPEYMAVANSESYESLLPKLRDGVGCRCSLSEDGKLKLYGVDDD